MLIWAGCRAPLGSPTRQIAIVVDGEVVSALVFGADVGPEGLDPSRVAIVIGSDDDFVSEQKVAVDLALALSR